MDIIDLLLGGNLSPEIVQTILGKNNYIIIKNNEGNIIFNSSGFKMSETAKRVELNGEEYININDNFYKIETSKVTKNNKVYQIIRISNDTKIMEIVKALHEGRDEKTGLLSPKAFITNIGSLKYDLKEHNIPFCLVMMDIDDFKLINDKYGHVHGDKVLADISKILLNSVRKGDLVGRFGRR